MLQSHMRPLPPAIQALFRFAALALLFASTPLHAFEVSRPEIIGPAPYSRSWNEMATNGSGSLVVWTDLRPGISFETTAWAAVTVRGALLDDRGNPTAPHDFAIAPSSNLVAVTSNGSEYLVVTAEYRGQQWTGELRFNIVTTEGRVRTSNVVRGQFNSIAAAGGDYYATIFRDDALRFVVFDEDARPLGGDVELGPHETYATLFGTSDGRLLASWRIQYQPTRVAFLSTADLAAGRFVPATQPQVLWEQFPPRAIVETDDGFVLSWHYGGLSTAIVDGHGAIVKNVEEAYSLPASAFQSRDAVILPTTNGLLAVDSAGIREFPFNRPEYGVATRRLDDHGSSIGDFTLIDDDAWHVAAAPARGGGGVITYVPAGSQQVRVRRVSASGEIELAAGEVVATRSLPSQHDAVVARCGETSIIAWSERTGEAKRRVLYRRFGSALDPVDPPNVLAGMTTEIETPLALECGRSSALLAWADGAVLRGILFPLDAGAPRTVTLGAASSVWGPSSMTFDGTGYVLARASIVERWSENGELLLASQVAPAGFFAKLAVGWNGTELLLAGDRYAPQAYPSIVARRLDRNFNRIGSDVVVRSSTGTWWSEPRVAAAEGTWLVAWIQQETVTYGFEPRSTRISRWGTTLDPDGGVVSGPKTRTLALTSNGTAFEILTEHAVTRRSPDGTVRTVPLLDADAWLQAIEAEGDTPLLVFWRTDPVHEVRRLFAERVARTWSPPRIDRERPRRP